MEANFTIDPELLPNEAGFTDSFFQQFTLGKADEPLELDHGISKHYSFPTFYADVTCAMAIFFCNYQAAEALMPHPSMKPIKSTLGRAIVAFSCYEYKKVLNIAPYNEIAMTIPVMVGGGFSPPLLPLVMKSFTRSGFYVFSMPVTSYENQLRGNKIWGLPKVTERIDIDTSNGHCTTAAYDKDGVKYFELKVPTQGKPKQFDESGFLYSLLDDELLKSETNFKGDFAINANIGRLFSKGSTGNGDILKLGDSPRADVLRKLQLESTPFQFRYCPSLNSCFDQPIQNWQ